MGAPGVGGAVPAAAFLKLALLLAPPLLWLVVVYLGALVALVLQSFYKYDDFTGTVKHTFTLDTWHAVLTRVTVETTLRTAGMAAAVTVACVVIAYPIAWFMARYATRRARTVLFVMVLIPLW